MRPGSTRLAPDCEKERGFFTGRRIRFHPITFCLLGGGGGSDNGLLMTPLSPPPPLLLHYYQDHLAGKKQQLEKRRCYFFFQGGRQTILFGLMCVCVCEDATKLAKSTPEKT